MKKLMALALAALLLLGMVSAGSAEGESVSYAQLAEMARYLRQVATSDYMTINGVPEDIQSKAREWTAGIEGDPRLIVKLDVDQCAYLMQSALLMRNEHPMVIYEADSTAKVYLAYYMIAYASREYLVGETSYEEIIEVNDQLNCEMIFAAEYDDADDMYFVFYEDAQPILLNVTCENGAVNMRAFLMPSPRLKKCQSYGQVALWLMGNGMAMTCTEVLPD